MRHFLINSLLISVCLIFASSSQAEEPSKDVCIDTRHYAVGFFNGMNNSYQMARDNLQALKALLSDGWKEPENYELFYNHTKGFFDDLFEVFAQRYAEADFNNNGGLSYLEIFWFIYQIDNNLAETIGGGTLKEITKKVKDFESFVNNIDDYLVASIASYISKAMADEYNTITQADYAKHSAQLSSLLAKNYKLVLVAHSQGNLFVNHLYEKTVMGNNSKYPNMSHYVRVVHVAPPTRVLHGPYILNKNDRVIGALGVLMPIPEPNWNSGMGISNHDFIETYLKGGESVEIYRMILTEAMDMDNTYNKNKIGFEIHTINTGDGLLNFGIKGPNREGCPPGETCLPGVIIPLGLYGERYIMGCSEYGGAPEGTYHVNTWEKCYSYSGSPEGLPVRTFSADLIVKNGQGKKIIDKTVTLPMPPCLISTENAKPIPLFSVTIKSSKNTKPEADVDIKE